MIKVCNVKEWECSEMSTGLAPDRLCCVRVNIRQEVRPGPVVGAALSRQTEALPCVPGAERYV